MHSMYIFFEKCFENGFNALSSIASLITIFGVAGLFFYYRRLRISRKCRKNIISDLTRHIFVNCAIIEAIRLNMNRTNYRVRPADGVFLKFAFLETDNDLGRFSITSYKYNVIHELSLILRNYNIVASIAEKHFSDRDFPLEYKLKDLDELFSRGIDITKSLLDLGKEFGLNTGTCFLVQNIIKNKTLIRQGIYNVETSQCEILNRDRFENHSYYDTIGLTKEFNECILGYLSKFYFMPVK